MKIERLAYEPAALVDFYEESFTVLGALCERTWHDRLQIVAEGQAAKLWNADGTLHEIELTFAPADTATSREAAREVFPGCPLTFNLAQALRPLPLPLDRVVLPGETRAHPPDATVTEKLWRGQFPGTSRWHLAEAFQPGFHFSLVALVRCEIQTIDQHWSLHRLAVSLSGGEVDDSLAREISFARPAPEALADIPWPTPEPARWQTLLRDALEEDLAVELAAVRARQESYLRRELDRIDEYFAGYEQELTARASRTSSQSTKLRSGDRLAAARAEHARRRDDQLARHEIRVQPHLDALLLVAEPAWHASLQVEQAHQPQSFQAWFVPRARRWFLG